MAPFRSRYGPLSRRHLSYHLRSFGPVSDTFIQSPSVGAFFRSDDLLSYILESGFMSLSDVVAFSHTETYARDTVLSLFHRWITANVSGFLSNGSFNNYSLDCLPQFFRTLHASGSAIGGSTALKILQFPVMQWEPKDLNIFTPKGGLAVWNTYLYSNGFRHIPSDPGLDGVWIIGTFTHRVYEASIRGGLKASRTQCYLITWLIPFPVLQNCSHRKRLEICHAPPLEPPSHLEHERDRGFRGNMSLPVCNVPQYKPVRLVPGISRTNKPC